MVPEVELRIDFCHILLNSNKILPPKKWLDVLHQHFDEYRVEINGGPAWLIFPSH